MHMRKKAYEVGRILALYDAGLVGQEKVGMLLEKVAVTSGDWVDELVDRMQAEGESAGAGAAGATGARAAGAAGALDDVNSLSKHKGKIIGGLLGGGALLGGAIGAGLGTWSDEPGSVARGGMTGMGAGAGTGAGLLGSGALLRSMLISEAAAEASKRTPGGMYGRGIAALALPVAGLFGGGALGHWAGNKATGHTDTAAPRR